jgi:hypothetical protein
MLERVSGISFVYTGMEQHRPDCKKKKMVIRGMAVSFQRRDFISAV